MSDLVFGTPRLTTCSPSNFLGLSPSVEKTTKSSTPSPSALDSPFPQDPHLQPLSKVDPLFLIHLKELEEMNRSEKQIKTPLKDQRCVTPHPLVGIESLHSAANLTALAVSAHYIVIGNCRGQVHLLSNEVKVLESRRKDIGGISCLDISYDEKFIAAGFDKGHIGVWEIKSASCICLSNAFNQSSVQSVLFYKLSRRSIVSTDCSGNLQCFKLSISMFSSSLKPTVLPINETKGVLEICVKLPLKKNAQGTIVVCTGDTVIVFNTQDFSEDSRFSRPENSDASPRASISDLLVIAWGNIIKLYTMQYKRFEEIGIYESAIFARSVHWITPNTVLVLSNEKRISIIHKQDFLEDSRYVQEEVPIFNLRSNIATFDNKAYFIDQDSAKSCRILNWQERMSVFIERDDWVEALSYGLEQYELFDEGKPFLEEQVKQFVRSTKIPLDFKIQCTFEFCLGIHSPSLIIDDFFEYFLDIGKGRETLGTLIEAMEPHLIMGKFRTLPIMILGRLIGYYMSIKRPYVIEKIILHLDPTTLDPSQLIPLCKERALLSSLVFLYTRSTEQSFVNPFNALYKSMEVQSDPRYKRFCLYKLLWYIRMCLRAETFPDGEIIPSQYPRAVVSVLNCLLKKVKDQNRLQKVLSIDTKSTLDVLTEAFYGQASEILQAYSPHTQKEILERLQEDAENSQQLTMFFAKLATLDESFISRDVVLSTIDELARPQKQRFSRYFSNVNTIERFIDLTANKDGTSNEIAYTVEEKNDVIIKIFKKKNITAEEGNSFYDIFISSPFTEVVVYLQELRGEYQECVKSMVRSENRYFKEKIFDWLDNTFPKVSEKYQEEIKREVMHSLNVLVQIDSERTADIVNEWYADGHSKIIGQLDSTPEIQLRYLRNILKGDFKIDPVVVLKYIQLLCVYSQGEVLPFLKENIGTYPIEGALECCKLYQLKRPSAFLYESLGDAKNACQLYIQAIQDKFREEVDVEGIQEDIKDAYRLCKRNARSLDEYENCELWFPLLECVFYINKHLVGHGLFPETIAAKATRKILESMTDHIQFDKILNFIDRHYGEAPFLYFQGIFNGMLAKYAYQTSILRTATNLLNSDVKTLATDLYTRSLKGISPPTNLCYACRTTIGVLSKYSRQDFDIYPCGHMYHSECNLSEECFCQKINM